MTEGKKFIVYFNMIYNKFKYLPTAVFLCDYCFIVITQYLFTNVSFL